MNKEAESCILIQGDVVLEPKLVTEIADRIGRIRIDQVYDLGAKNKPDEDLPDLETALKGYHHGVLVIQSNSVISSRFGQIATLMALSLDSYHLVTVSGSWEKQGKRGYTYRLEEILP